MQQRPLYHKKVDWSYVVIDVFELLLQGYRILSLENLRKETELNSFKRALKTHLFKLSY